MSSKNKKCSDGCVAYKPVASLTHDAQHVVDLYIHGPKSPWSNDAWLGQGRPLDLSSLTLSTWTLLTTSIKEHQVGLQENSRRAQLSVIIPINVLLAIVMMIIGSVTIFSQDGHNGDFWANAFIPCLFLGMVVAICVPSIMVPPLEKKYLDETFNPVVQAVLDELTPKLTEDGYKVTLMVTLRPVKAFLRFAPLPDEEMLEVARKETML